MLFDPGQDGAAVEVEKAATAVVADTKEEVELADEERLAESVEFRKLDAKVELEMTELDAELEEMVELDAELEEAELDEEIGATQVLFDGVEM